jgi:hypothetical protein
MAGVRGKTGKRKAIITRGESQTERKRLEAQGDREESDRQNKQQ